MFITNDLFQGFNRRNLPPCNSKQLHNISNLILNNLMRESYQATPERCTTMKVVVVPDIQNSERVGKKFLRLVFIFPAKFTEIKDEKVHTDEG